MAISLSNTEVEAVVQAAYPRPDYTLFSFFNRVMTDPNCHIITFRNCLEYFAGLANHYTGHPEFKEEVIKTLSEYLLCSTSQTRIAIVFRYLASISEDSPKRVKDIFNQLSPENQLSIRISFSIPE